jgi:hypothetical protein
MAQKKTICEINFTRDNGDQILSIRVSPELEKLFKTESTETSNVYKDKDGDGLVYYKLSDKLNQYAEKYRQELDRVELTRYGTDLFIDGYIANLSILRTKGIGEGVEVKVNNLIVDADVQRWIEKLAKFVKFLYTNFVEKTSIKASINLEF